LVGDVSEQVLMVNNYEQNVKSLTKKLKNVAGLLEQRVSVSFSLHFVSFDYTVCVLHHHRHTCVSVRET